jgi:hypothetical protein
VTQPGVYVIRVEEAAPEGYVLDAYLGRAYAATLADQPNTTPVWGYMCIAAKDRCGGSAPNHYFSLSSASDPDLPDWRPLCVKDQVRQDQILKHCVEGE